MATADPIRDAMSAAAASALCTACGLCCDGSFFKRTPIEPDEVPALERLGFRIGTDKRLHLAQCCPALEDRRCSIYDVRPSVCGKFSCALLRRFRAGEVTIDDARKVIRTARQLTKKAMAADAENPDVGQDWRSIGDRDERLAAAQRHLDRSVRNTFVRDHFLNGSRRKQTMDVAASEVPTA